MTYKTELDIYCALKHATVKNDGELKTIVQRMSFRDNAIGFGTIQASIDPENIITLGAFLSPAAVVLFAREVRIAIIAWLSRNNQRTFKISDGDRTVELKGHYSAKKIDDILSIFEEKKGEGDSSEQD